MASAAFTLGCADQAPVAPQRGAAAAPASLLTVSQALDSVTILELAMPLPQDITVGDWIGRKGGYIGIPEAGVWLVVPEGAVQRRTYFTLTARAGKLASYEFGPHGSTFPVPLQVYQDLMSLNLWPLLADSWTDKGPDRGWKIDGTNDQLVQAGYFPSWSNVDEASGTATVRELLPARVSIIDRYITFNVQHFSGYLLASGRAGTVE